MSELSDNKAPAQNKSARKIVVLKTDLFPDAATLEAALLTVGDGMVIEHFDVAPGSMGAAQWDQLLLEILSADKVVTL